MKVLIVGGNGGIGQGMVKLIQESYPDATVHATNRHHVGKALCQVINTKPLGNICGDIGAIAAPGQ